MVVGDNVRIVVEFGVAVKFVVTDDFAIVVVEGNAVVFVFVLVVIDNFAFVEDELAIGKGVVATLLRTPMQ